MRARHAGEVAVRVRRSVALLGPRSAADGFTRPCLEDSRFAAWGGAPPLTPERDMSGATPKSLATYFFCHSRLPEREIKMRAAASRGPYPSAR
jgi:hypothetical protein